MRRIFLNARVEAKRKINLTWPRFTYELALVCNLQFTIYKFALAGPSAKRCFQPFPNWSKFDSEPILLWEILPENSQLENFIDECYRRLLSNTHTLKQPVPAVRKKSLYFYSFPDWEFHHCKLGLDYED